MNQYAKVPVAAALLLCGVALVLSGCAVSGGSPTFAPGTPIADSLSYSNQTTIGVTLVVNAAKVATLPPGAAGTVPPSSLPAEPWTVQAKTSGGRLLTSMTVSPGDVVQASGQERGDAVRIDLSCGRLDIWSGPPLAGPAPGSGTPGDCAP